jgi:hypothetical protein
MKVNDLQMAVVMCRSGDDRLSYEQASALFASVPISRVMNGPTSFVPVIKSGAAFNSTATADYITGLRFKGVKTHFPTAAITGTSVSKGCSFSQSELSKGWMIVRKSEGTGSSAVSSFQVTNIELSAASSAAMVATSMKEEVKVFSYTGALESFKIPAGVSSISIKAWGAGGCVFDETPIYAASHNAEYGGAGGFSAATISVKAGETVYVEVGQGARRYGSGSGGYPNGGDGYNGGCAGGGSSNVYIDGYGKPEKVVLVAGGGGGAGWYTPSGAKKQGNGAAGGGVIAQDGGANAGSGGSQTAGGQTGNGKGAALQGGASSGNGGTGGPGGGGGGYFGGASGVGGNNNTNGGGGGGSCYVGPAANGGALASNAGSKGINDYVDPAGSVRKLGDRSFSAAECMSGSGKMPPKTTDPDYLAGIATGGAIADVVQVPGWSANHKTAKGGDGRVVIRYSVPVSQVQATTSASCGTSQVEVSQLGCLYKDGERYLIGVIRQNVINPTQVSGAINLSDESKVIDDTRWQSVWNRANATSDGNWRLVAQMETSADTWETVVAPPANNIHLMKNANRLPLVKSLAAPVLTAYVYSLFHHEDSGDTWTGGDYSGIIYGGPNGYSTFGWYNQATSNNFFGAKYNYASLKMRLWLYPPVLSGTASPENTVAKSNLEGFYSTTIMDAHSGAGSVGSRSGFTSGNAKGASNGFRYNAPAGTTNYYSELKITNANWINSHGFVGVCDDVHWSVLNWTSDQGVRMMYYLGNNFSYGEQTGSTQTSTNHSSGVFAQGDILGIVVNQKAGKVNFYKNGVLLATISNTKGAGKRLHIAVSDWYFSKSLAAEMLTSPSVYVQNYLYP